ncbi:SGNH/GDSL hydrolase family protein [Xanthobacter aminoxidans]|uniref:SGNH/GDSL hydrolase family protein n=1 Tax=Xanthobacter aminoxidans TaxID=186280 RepID=UPI002022B9E8|nr:SGNH/GDSL hydrolase family protein [Xanthobacter aminoxidans]MCL8380614.1 SGNH/GDSL hydrolase family protein [Xanthobacter aminoxidans]
MRRAGGVFLAVWLLLCPLAAGATISSACRVPDIFLAFDSDLVRTERLVDRSAPVRILMIGPQPDRQALSDKKRSRLETELSNRLPNITFTIIDEGATQGLARDDFGRIRSAVERVAPDLIIWQVGTADALAATDPESFAHTLEQAADWLRGRNIDLVLIDPPFVPGVDHEHLYGRIVKQIDAVSDRERMNVVQQYGATSYLQSSARSPAEGRACMAELVAEAIVKAVTR